MAIIKNPLTIISSGGGNIDALIDGTITSVESNATTIKSYSFQDCGSLTSANFPLATSIGSYSFRNCGSLTSISFPLATTLGNYSFSNCPNLTSISFPLATSIGSNAFSLCTALTSLTLGANQVCSLTNTNAIPASISHHITIYVPSDLIASYQTASNWVTLYNNGYITFTAIS